MSTSNSIGRTLLIGFVLVAAACSTELPSPAGGDPLPHLTTIEASFPDLIDSGDGALDATPSDVGSDAHVIDSLDPGDDNAVADIADTLGEDDVPVDSLAVQDGGDAPDDNTDSEAPSDTCLDGEQNVGETDQDCGGPCAPCGNGLGCLGDEDCESGVCDLDFVCMEQGCEDGRQNGGETDLDCGGPACSGCPLGGSCLENRDCDVALCSGGTCYYARDCAELRFVRGIEVDGIYTIDPDGQGVTGVMHFEVYCDMSTDGGGWTLVGRSSPGSGDPANCEGSDFGEHFGWKRSWGSAEDETQEYSLDVDSKMLDDFDEFLFGSYITGKMWGANVYKHSVPPGFVDNYGDAPLWLGAPSTVLGACDDPDLFHYAGYTNNPDTFHFRELSGNGWGLSASYFQVCYDDCDLGGSVNGLPGMIFVRRSHCSDGVLSGDETDVDCGGASCDPCAPG